MKIIPIHFGAFCANTYVITADGKNAVVIDPSHARIQTELEKRGLQARYVLLTHCHFDHIGGVSVLQETGAKVLCSAQEKPLIGTSADLCEYAGAPPSDYAVDETFLDNQTRCLCGMEIQTLITAGHTKGSACYLFMDETGEKHLFTGDTLFDGSIGRTDFPTGNVGEMRASLVRLASLKGDMAIYAGHGEPTTLNVQRQTNPFLMQ